MSDPVEPVDETGCPPVHRTKIVATLGPAIETEESIEAMIRAGTDVFRLNFSHADHDWHVRAAERLRRRAKAMNRPVALLADLRGPRIRIGRLPAPLHLRREDEVVLSAAEDAATAESPTIPVQYKDFAKDVEPGEHVLIADGLIELVVKRIEDLNVVCRVRFGGLLSSYKGINLPGSQVSAPALGDKDLLDLTCAIEMGVDYVALSFVRNAADLEQGRQLLEEQGSEAHLLAKIERPEAVHRLDEILAAADGVMVARGDLGVEMGMAEIPVLQKRIIKAAVQAGIPVITATQMMESMIENPRPTRAEATDVANAILDGTDATMLSAETATGRYPCETVEAMCGIATRAEEHLLEPAWYERLRRTAKGADSAVQEVAMGATAYAAERSGATAVAVFTESGRTARLLAARRIATPVFAFTPEQRTFQRMALYWGIEPVLIDGARNVEDMVFTVEEELLERGAVRPGDRILIASGATNVSAATNSMRIHTVGQ